jgi:tetratricopeptide (TPR) repeat protein
VRTFLFIVVFYVCGCANSAIGHMQSGITFYQQKQYKGALEQFDRAVQIDSDMPEIYFHRGNLYCDWEKQYDKAIADYNKAVALKPDYLQVYINRANIYKLQAKYDEAIADYNKAVALKPDYILLYTNRANIYKLQSKYDEAIRDYETILQLDANNARAYYNMALIYKEYYNKKHDIKELNQVKVYVNKALDRDPENADFYRTRAELYSLEKDYTKAIDDYNKIMQLNSQDYRALMDRGIAYFQLNDYTNAYIDFNECIAHGFQDPQIEVYRKKIIHSKKN